MILARLYEHESRTLSTCHLMLQAYLYAFVRHDQPCSSRFSDLLSFILLALVNRSHPAAKGDSGDGNSGENGDSTYVMTEDHAAAFETVLLVG